MCIFKACPLYATCEKEVEQVVYCRHVEMIKKIGKLRLEMRKKVEAVSVGNAIATPEQSHSELKALSDRPALGEIN